MGGVKAFEAQHLLSDTLYITVVLFDDIVQIFTLTYFDTATIVLIELFDTGFIGATFINVNQTGFYISDYGFGQKL